MGPINVTHDPRAAGQPAWSPDNSRIAFMSTRDGHSHVYTARPDGSDVVQVSAGDADDSNPVWSPDSSRLLYTRVDPRDGWSKGPDGTTMQIAFCPHHTIREANADGSQDRELFGLTGSNVEPCWSPDGRQIAFANIHESKGVREHDLVLANSDGSQLHRLTQKEGVHPSWSPDGGEIAYVSGDFMSVLGSLRVVRPDGSYDRKLQNANIESRPAWSPDSSHIAYQGQDDNLYTTTPQMLHAAHRVASGTGGLEVDQWSPDGRLLLATNYDHPLLIDLSTGSRKSLEPDASAAVFSSDGSRLAYQKAEGKDMSDVYVVDTQWVI